MNTQRLRAELLQLGTLEHAAFAAASAPSANCGPRKRFLNQGAQRSGDGAVRRIHAGLRVAGDWYLRTGGMWVWPTAPGGRARDSIAGASMADCPHEVRATPDVVIGWHGFASQRHQFNGVTPSRGSNVRRQVIRQEPAPGLASHRMGSPHEHGVCICYRHFDSLDSELLSECHGTGTWSCERVAQVRPLRKEAS